jgi:hypothetical protein
MPAFIEQLAICILARFAVIDAVAVADVEAIGRAKPPNRVLHEPWKQLRKLPVKGAGIDLAGDGANDVGTAAIRPGNVAVLANIATSYLVRDALVAEGVQKPVEYLGRVTNSDGLKNTGLQYISADIVQKCQRPS